MRRISCPLLISDIAKIAYIVQFVKDLMPTREAALCLGRGARRVNLRAKLDAVYFRLCGVTDRDDVRYIYSTFPVVERGGGGLRHLFDSMTARPNS
jgi:hypothetical protein